MVTCVESSTSLFLGLIYAFHDSDEVRVQTAQTSGKMFAVKHCTTSIAVTETLKMCRNFSSLHRQPTFAMECGEELFF